MVSFYFLIIIDNFLALKYATDKGVIVTEAAGNGAESLDNAIYNRPISGISFHF
jgi:hypothetical protein